MCCTRQGPGQPKGVGISHAALAERTWALGEIYGLASDDRFLQFLSFSFDAFGEEFYPTLTRGLVLVIYRGAKSLLPQEMAELIARERITILHIPPTYWGELERHRQQVPGNPPWRLRLLITGGEAIPKEKAERWVRTCKCPLWNAYGPTEATITASAYYFSFNAAGNRNGTEDILPSDVLWKALSSTS